MSIVLVNDNITVAAVSALTQSDAIITLLRKFLEQACLVRIHNCLRSHDPQRVCARVADCRFIAFGSVHYEQCLICA